MQTITMELTAKELAAFVNLVHLAAKGSGLDAIEPGALVLPILKRAQIALNRQGNGAAPFTSPPDQSLGDVVAPDRFDETTEVTIDG